ncbi:MAG: hypothetical protein WAM51_05030, partial [Methylovirgula sp.]
STGASMAASGDSGILGAHISGLFAAPIISAPDISEAHILAPGASQAGISGRGILVRALSGIVDLQAISRAWAECTGSLMRD